MTRYQFDLMESYLRIVLSIGVFLCMAAKPVQATLPYALDAEPLTHHIQPLSYKGDALFVAQLQDQENRLPPISDTTQTVNQSDLNSSSILSAASCVFSWGVSAQDSQEKYMRFAQATRYVGLVWPERQALSMPREFIAAPYYAALFAGNEEDKIAYFNLWRSWEREYSGEKPVIECDVLKTDARILHVKAQKLYHDFLKSEGSENSEKADSYKNLTLKSVTLWKEILEQREDATVMELLECLENCLVMRRISGPYPNEYNVYGAQVLEKFLVAAPALTPQECFQAAAYNFAVSMLFKSHFSEKCDSSYRPHVFKEQHLNNGYNLLQKITDTDLRSIEDVMVVSDVYELLGKASCRAGFSHACYARAAQICEKGLEFTSDKLALFLKIKSFYAHAYQSLLSPDMFNSMEVTSWQNWQTLLTGSPAIVDNKNNEKEILSQKYMKKIYAYLDKMTQEEERIIALFKTA